ncbi:MAG: thermonuclease family protein [Armatimonadetes bacterium]|nr:thermonuclease family protein [Armatimonadota bacterium]
MRRSRRTRNTTVSLVAVALVLLASALWYRWMPARGDFVGRVVGVSDGDTIEVMRAGRAVRVRLEGIDCPESGQAYGTRAKQFTSELVFGKEVAVQVRGTDQYGRILGEVILPDGRSLNRELVRNGYAWWYRRYSNDPVLQQLEEEARRERRGLWRDRNPIPPWEFRRERRRSDSTPLLRPSPHAV